jgi:16S rRNA (cytidine1402-2'-O)-methyltransferase
MEKLYVVATPIGNLEDLTLRALRVLREAHLIACEDTRHTGKLLAHFEIKKPLLSCHQHNEKERAKKVLAALAEGKKVALVSDAGTPAVSDPGAILVQAVLDAGGKVEPIPGACALTAALSASGFSADHFLFEGFLPAKASARKSRLQEIAEERHTLVFYEAPHRLLETLNDLHLILGSRRGCVVRELTKLHEEFVHGSIEELLHNFKKRPAIKGECVVIVEGFHGQKEWEQTPEEEALTLISEGFSQKEAAKQVSQRRGLSARAIYQALLKKNFSSTKSPK